MTRTIKHPPSYQWVPQPEAQAVINEYVDSFLRACPFATNLAHDMSHRSGTKFIDWVDFIEAPDASDLETRLIDVGFVETPDQDNNDETRVFEHHDGLFPLFVLSNSKDIQLGIKVDSVSDFLSAWSITNDYKIEGAPFASLRRVRVSCETSTTLWAVERHGCRTLCNEQNDPERCMSAMRHYESLRRRRRDWPSDALGWERVNALVDAAIYDLGVDTACELFFRAERDYWQRRNRAARIQKSRQDELGLGWANHDHHTYRSSRKAFKDLVHLLEKLGFVCRERFYAGKEAGWGAQVLEQPECRLVIFADVDLSEEEIVVDFAHEGLQPRDYLGTIGIWAGLHGESMLQAGMHHLECQFDYNALRDQLQSAGIQSMPPFTQLAYLKQAFTEGERWQVDPVRVNRLLEAKLITPAQANNFKMNGAIGSHLENLERFDGYKGFNQHGVSDIIERTDPRHQNNDDPLIGA
tara:strand:- start:4112 stop:5512 length:1401 start_codon:yes stop_codon:yes gene_type:complete